ncbi:sugar phosphate isomerase/epimerase [Candidatus Chloroploca sp. M-50]|uniref:Sugar phosphate isomerase/epimerase n=1 Tax=Candidatus Chloroploca mongolica TaxID=2528176 RepID=A0ABS4D739_9CHLR|nr:sugar phosphate isomerase/epimerase family protein [Candidatus Chloroploca mongolica]MBP1465243.1 sugar phosphate isomerase/epimerase [Candidatus Chloroploca mongolica]
MIQQTVPLIGAALQIKDLEVYRDWLLDGPRDLEIQDPIAPEVLDGDWRTAARHAREMLRGYTGRLGIHGPFLGLDLAPYDPKVRQVVIERLRQGLAFAEAVGATHMVLHSPFLCFGTPAHVFTPFARREWTIKEAHAVIEPLLPQAEALDCMLVIETIADGSVAPLLDLVRSFDTPLVRLSIDVGHVCMMQQIGGPTPDQWVREAGDLLAHVHLQDTDGHLDRHWAPGDGAINWYAFFTALQTLSHQPRLLLELEDHAHIPRGMAYLTRCGFAC